MEKKKVLHVGCGTRPVLERFSGPDWEEVRFDIDPDVKPHIVASMLDMNMIKDGEFDAVWSSHNLEHLYPHQVPVALGEFFRVLKNGGHLLITMPDLQAVASHVANDRLEETLYISNAGPISAIDILYGFRPAMQQGNLFMAHRTGFTAKTLGLKLLKAGFSGIELQRDQLDLWAIAYRSVAKPKDQLILLEKDDKGNITRRNILEKVEA